MSSTVKDVMSTHVIAVRRNASYKEMASMLRDQRVSAFPVIDDDSKVIGVVSESDLLVKEALTGGAHPTLQSLPWQRVRSQVNGVTAADLMSKPAVTIGPDDAVRTAARLMFSRRIKRLPVVDKDGRLIGIVTRSDVLSVYRRADEDIRREVTQDVILASYLCDPAKFTVTVVNGIVTIEGTPETARAGHDIIDSIGHTEGVVAVRDRLTYPAAQTYRRSQIF
jgi:CBS domain-containing protein